MTNSGLAGHSDIHPSAIIGRNVSIGAGSTIGPFAVIGGSCIIGRDAWVGAGVVLGSPPEIRGGVLPRLWWDDDDGPGLRIGDRVVIREAAQIHSGSGSPTALGDDCYVMNQAYVAHDCLLANGVTLSSSATLAGHTSIGRHATIGLGVTVHQHRAIGAYAMVGMSAAVTRDIPPFVIAHGVPARPTAANRLGMERAGFSVEAIEWVRTWIASGSELMSSPIPDELMAELNSTER